MNFLMTPYLAAAIAEWPGMSAHSSDSKC